MLLGIFLISLGAFMVGLLAALRWMDFAWAELLDLRKDRDRLDWLEEELVQREPMVRMAFRGFFDRERRFWVDCRVPVRRMLDTGRQAARAQRRAA